VRIIVANEQRGLVGGAETYLDQLMPALAKKASALGFLYDQDVSAERDSITVPNGTTTWNTSTMRTQELFDRLTRWAPDVIYLQSLQNVALIQELARRFRVVSFIHCYNGTCISGAKTFKFPVIRPCQRRFGSPCLFLFYPRRCGGLNPLTLWRDYQKQQQRLGFLRRCAAVVTHSRHMREEYLRHGFAPDKVICLPHFVAPPATLHRNSSPLAPGPTPVASTPHSALRTPHSPFRLLFLGRMDHLKGGHYLLKALPKIQQALKRPMDVTFAGEGPARAKWEEQAKGIALTITFTGWLEPEQRDELLESIDLLVVPSLWPEPFGQVGLEAGHHGIPAAAYDVGGISEWLKEGVNGHLASGNPPTPEGLGDAVINCLADSDHYAHLRLGALQMTRRFDLQSHVAALEEVFRKVVNLKGSR
jgi:glycosyltransferase involved in cell wall biosynthesis